MKKIISILVMVMVVMFSACSSKTETPEEVIRAYIEACLKGNLDEANSYWSKRADKDWIDGAYTKINKGFNENVEDNTKFTYKYKTTKKENNFRLIEVYMLNKTAKAIFDKYRTSIEAKVNYETGEIIEGIKTEIPNLYIQLIFENKEWKIQTI